MKRTKLANRLLLARRGGRLLDEVPVDVRPASIASAYAIADEIVAALRPALGQIAGYKIGATSIAGQQMLGLEAPFYGRAFARRILRSGGRWRASLPGDSVEAEVGFVMGRALPAGRAAYDETQVRRAIRRVVPLLEINRPGYARPFEVGGHCLIADNGVTQGFVRGVRGVAPGTASFAGETVVMSCNGKEVARGSAAVVLGDPLRALVWLANALSAQGRGLAAGDLVASGAITPPFPLGPGDSIVARFSSLGPVGIDVPRLRKAPVMPRRAK